MRTQLMRAGFTIVELIIVISVVAILVTVTAVAYNGITRDAREKSLLADANSVAGEVARFGTHNSGIYNSSVEWFSASPTNPTNPNINFTPSSGNVIDVVVNNSYYCVRAYNPDTDHSTIATAFAKGSDAQACLLLDASVEAGGTGGKIVGWWKLNGSVADATNTGLNGTAANLTAAVGQNGQANSAYAFNGGNSQMSRANETAFNPARLTVSAWFNIDPAASTSIIHGIVTKDLSSGFSQAPYELSTNTTTSTVLFRITESSNTTRSVTCPTVPTVNTWYQAVGTYDGTTMRLYLNGVACGTATTAADIGQSTGAFRIGQQRTGQSRWFHGLIDDVRLSNYALSADDVQKLYSLGAQ